MGDDDQGHEENEKDALKNDTDEEDLWVMSGGVDQARRNKADLVSSFASTTSCSLHSASSALYNECSNIDPHEPFSHLGFVEK